MVTQELMEDAQGTLSPLSTQNRCCRIPLLWSTDAGPSVPPKQEYGSQDNRPEKKISGDPTMFLSLNSTVLEKIHKNPLGNE